jgi:acetyl-CoA decarbonylase/synthase complex subunit beta
VFTIEKGEVIDPKKGEFSGINDTIKQKTLGEIDKVWLYTAFGYPHTSCGCFEAVAFYIPEVDGFGVVDRGFKGATVNGLAFSTLANSTSGGRQIDGFHGVSIEYMRSPKFLQVDGGWDRIVWLPAAVKERIKDFVPQEVVDKIATENDAKTVEDLKVFLENNEHPVVKLWKAVSVEPAPEIEEALAVSGVPLPTATISTGGFRLILKNVKIHAEKLIVKREK